MLTHVLWFMALVVCCALTKSATEFAARLKHDVAIETMRGHLVSAQVALSEGAERWRSIAAKVEEIAAQARAESTSWEKRYNEERMTVMRLLTPMLIRSDGSIEPLDDPPTVGQADMLAVEEHRREQLRIEGENDITPPSRLDSSEADEERD